VTVHDWLRSRAEQVIETSCAWVFLEADRALKVKKPVDYGFLDFSTLDKRRWAIERELRFNRATAPDIYRALRNITRETSGFAFDGEGETVEVALEMRRFDPDAVLSQHPDTVDATLAETLGRTIARFHAKAEVRPEGGGVKALGYTIRTNAEHLRTMSGVLGAEPVERVIAATDKAFVAASPLLELRRAQGFGRRCHGDLHLGNILLEHGAPVLFDCIEFNDLLSEIDVLYDVAFLIMDLWFRGRREPANRVLNAYLDEAARAFPHALWDGLVLLPLLLATRAAVRAHVTANQGEPDAARAYLAAAAQHLTPPPARLIAIGGLSGTGKTTLARRLAPDLGGAPGAVILRSDEIRKRLAGVGPLDRIPRRAYTSRRSAETYGEMFRLAGRLLDAGRTVVLDAVFLGPDLRAAAEELASEAEVPFHGLWLEGQAEQLRARLNARQGDASDADAVVLEEQLDRDAGPISWIVADAAKPDAALAALIAQTLDQTR
jgi:aminoglycoside phosphotransferase family enzyme/predicted kinase